MLVGNVSITAFGTSRTMVRWFQFLKQTVVISGGCGCRTELPGLLRLILAMAMLVLKWAGFWLWPNLGLPVGLLPLTLFRLVFALTSEILV